MLNRSLFSVYIPLKANHLASMDDVHVQVPADISPRYNDAIYTPQDSSQTVRIQVAATITSLRESWSSNRLSSQKHILNKYTQETNKGTQLRAREEGESALRPLDVL